MIRPAIHALLIVSMTLSSIIPSWAMAADGIGADPYRTRKTVSTYTIEIDGSLEDFIFTVTESFKGPQLIVEHSEVRGWLPFDTKMVFLIARDLDQDGFFDTWFVPSDGSRPKNPKDEEDFGWLTTSAGSIDTYRIKSTHKSGIDVVRELLRKRSVDDRWFAGIVLNFLYRNLTITGGQRSSLADDTILRQVDLQTWEILEEAKFKAIKKPSRFDFDNYKEVLLKQRAGWENLLTELGREDNSDSYWDSLKKFTRGAIDGLLWIFPVQWLASLFGKVSLVLARFCGKAVAFLASKSATVAALHAFVGRVSESVAVKSAALAAKAAELAEKTGITSAVESAKTAGNGVRNFLTQQTEREARIAAFAALGFRAMGQAIDNSIIGLQSGTRVSRAIGHMMAGIKNGTGFTAEVAGRGLRKKEFLAVSFTAQMTGEYISRGKTMFDDPLILNAELRQNVAYMTLENIMIGGIHQRFEGPEYRKIGGLSLPALKYSALVSATNSTIMGFAFNDEPNYWRMGYDTGWEMTVSNAQMGFDNFLFSKFGIEGPLKHSASWKMKFVGMAISFTHQVTGFTIYSKFAERFSNGKAPVTEEDIKREISKDTMDVNVVDPNTGDITGTQNVNTKDVIMNVTPIYIMEPAN